MCSTKQFCGTCTPTDQILAYIEGRSHVLPVYGDGAQRGLAAYRRRMLFQEKFRNLDPGMVDWPEYRAMGGLTEHLNRLSIIAGKLMYLNAAPSGLKDALAADKDRIVASKEPNRRRFVTLNDRRRVIRRWVRENLAEAELSLLGRYCYAEQSVQSLPVLMAA